MLAPYRTSPLILASTSPYRRELMERLRLPFSVAASNVDEKPIGNETPAETAVRLSLAKAVTVSDCHPDAVVIGADQVAELDGRQIGKPGSHDRAMAQLRQMQGRRVIFHSAMAFIDPSANGNEITKTINIQTAVTFRSLPDRELEMYLRLEQPYDCAGSAKNEGLGIALLERIETIDPTALTGLPLIALTSFLRDAGFPMFRGT